MMRFTRLLALPLLAALFLAACAADPAPTAAPAALPSPPTPTAVSSAAADRGGTEPAEPAEPVAPTAVATSTRQSSAISKEERGFTVLFQPRPDGLGFRNYSTAYPEGDFTIAELRALFGDGVCSRIEGERCVPTAQAQQWIADRNADMSYGHCIGFTVAAHRFLQDELQPAAFTSSADVPFEIAQDVPIMRTIAANGALYWVDEVWSEEVSGAPSAIIDGLLALGEPVDLSIFLPGLSGGHSLLAYGVEQVAPEHYHILVYDNNLPGQEAYVSVDTAAETWRYDQGRPNPGLPATVYEGDAETNTLRYIPLSAYDGVDCPICATEAMPEDGSGQTLLSFLGQGEVLVETALGAIGFVDGELINEIPGARFILSRGTLAATGVPAMVLPEGVTAYEMRFNGVQRVSALNPALSVVVDALVEAPEQNALAVDEAARQLSFAAGGAQTPALVTSSAGEEATYRVALLGLSFEDGQRVALGAAADGVGLVLETAEANADEATLLVARQTATGEAIFASTAVAEAQGRGVALDLGGWNGRDEMAVTIDTNGDGVFDEAARPLPNEPVGDLLGQQDAGKAGQIAANLSPYLGAAALEDVLAGLAARTGTAEELAALLRPLALSDAQLLEAMETLELAPGDLALLLAGLRLGPARQATLLDGLELTAAERTAVRAALNDLALARELLAEWSFGGAEDLGLLAGILDGRGLSAARLARVLPRLGLSGDELLDLLLSMTLDGDDLVALAAELGLSLPAARGATATPLGTRAAGSLVTATPLVTGTITVTATLTPDPGGTAPAAGDAATGGGPPPTATPDPYPAPPGNEPEPPGGYPGAEAPPGGYPAPPQGTRTPRSYPAPEPTETPQPRSSAFCSGDDLQVVAQEAGWRGTAVTIRADEGLALLGTTGANGEPFSATVPGPGTWTNLRIEAAAAPLEVALGTVSCP